MNHKFKLVSHACVLLNFNDVTILTDPWLFGDVFNNGWSLLFKKTFLQKSESISQKEIDSITHIWISHEHPDHFHIPSLKFIASRISNFKKITVLLKKDLRTEKDIYPIFKKLGFLNIKMLYHNNLERLSEDISVAIYHHKHIDSALIILKKDKPFLINVNDSELNDNDCKLIKNKFGNFPILLNQFSIAGFEGILSEEKMKKKSKKILENMINIHNKLGAKTTLPIASFCWFSRQDNQFLNRWHNTLDDVYETFDKKDLNCYCTEPPSEYIRFEDIIGSSKKRTEDLIKINPMPEKEIKVSIEDLKNLILKRFKELKTKSNTFLFLFVEKDIMFDLKDTNFILILNIRNSSIEHKLKKDFNFSHLPRMIINLSSLHNAFKFPWGIQTLGVSGRYYFVNFLKIPRCWKLIRILSTLDNNKTPLRLTSFLNPSVYTAIGSRIFSFPMQFKQQLERFKDN